MPRKRLLPQERSLIEREMEILMRSYKRTNDPILKAKVRHKVRKALETWDISPNGYSVLPDYMRE